MMASDMNHLTQLQQWLKANDLQGLLVPSTDEFLSEFTPPAGESDRVAWLSRPLRRADRLALDAAVHSYPEVEKLRTWTHEAQIELVTLTSNPIDALWREGRAHARLSPVDDYSLLYAGQSA